MGWLRGYPLPIRNCTEHPNILDPRRLKVNAIDMTEKTMHERLVLVSGQAITGPLSPCPWRLHPHHFTLLLILEILNLNIYIYIYIYIDTLNVQDT